MWTSINTQIHGLFFTQSIKAHVLTREAQVYNPPETTEECLCFPRVLPFPLNLAFSEKVGNSLGSVSHQLLSDLCYFIFWTVFSGSSTPIYDVSHWEATCDNANSIDCGCILCSLLLQYCTVLTREECTLSLTLVKCDRTHCCPFVSCMRVP